MPSPPRLLFPRSMVLVTSRTEEGLPFVAEAYMSLILCGIMARAQALFPVKICHYVWMRNHFHMIIYVENPEDVENFIGRVKTESAHAINKLLGRRRRTIWVGDYDSVPILTLEDGLEKIKYVYGNPNHADKDVSIESYSRPSSWNAFVTGEHSIDAPWVQRPAITPELVHNPDAAQVLLDAATASHQLVIEPNAWMKIFRVTDPGDQERLNATMKEEIVATERESRKDVTTVSNPVPRKERIDEPYTPLKFARRMWCICRDIILRAIYIEFVKSLIAQGKEALKAWRRGEFSFPYPPGLAPPRCPRTASVLDFVPTGYL